MKTLVTLSALLLFALLPFASAQSGPPPISLPSVAYPMGGCADLAPPSKCLACCLSGFQEAIQICKENCTVCRTLFGLIPISCRVDKVCFARCQDLVWEVNSACQRDCFPPPKDEEEEDETPPTP